MAITITSEQYYKDGVAQTTPDEYNDNKYCWAGMSSTIRYVTLYTCETTVPLSSLTLEITHAGTDGTGSTKYLGMYVTATKNDSYLTDSTGGDTKLCFSMDCTDDGSFVSNGVARLARGTVTKNIPAGTFYIYIVPYQTNQNNCSTIRSIQMPENAPTITGEEIPCCVYIDSGSAFETYQCYIDNGSSWVLHAAYIDNGSSWEMCS